jgi:hypothetical protein
MELDPASAIIILLIIISLPTLFGALKDEGHLKMPKIGRRKSASSIRQFPTFPVDEELE